MENPAPRRPYLGLERRRGPRLSQEEWRLQERLSSITHAVAALLSLAALWLMVVAAARWGSLRHILSFTVFGGCMVFLFGASAWMHALPVGRARRVLERMDLSGIFLLIAGTYTPFMVVTLQGPLGSAMLLLVWLLAAGGILWIHWRRKHFEQRAAPLYLAMGWLIVLVLKPLSEHLPLPGVLLLFGGGLAYTLGVLFFFWTRYLHHHAIWHVFVMLGSLLHLLAVLFYVLPDMRAGNWP